MRLLPYGDRGLLVELADTAAVVAVAELVRTHPLVSELVADVVPGARTVLVVARAGVRVDRLVDVVPDERAVAEAIAQPVRQVRREDPTRIPVTYDGPDLAEVAALTGMDEREVVAAHTGTPWRVAFGGFAPGFAYLVGGDPRLRVPRRDEPRTSVPAGSVGLAGEFSGVYPRASPGGWQLIGRTDLSLWDLDRDRPALLSAGATVVFEEVR
ncbi:allophanate hydrolase subunit 1 [Nocardioides kongjuensis]|uniref:KipI family sensor histidine kinase inhibitor n=1 Tax=Nocardioides kongjuensis TaxID=349522 RepID=A0A852RUX5_9ACTN|nr:allophanate hydrolase subunit 1 [Nocardioides kongjuensis]NYD30372.1 KipI family sensor histidine kinase inhibitor [Nocardioides kongjuensis]